MTGRSLVRLEKDQRDSLNKSIHAGVIDHLDGTPVGHPLGEGLVTDDGRLVYRSDDGILALLPELAIPLAGEVALEQPSAHEAKRVVRTFYEEFGWKKEGDLYLDTLTFVDTRPLSLEHLARCHRRIGRELPASGRFVLDAASGPVQFPEYRRLSDPFDFRVCIDFSVRALREAQSNLGDRGLYLLGDVTRLPLRDGSMDAALSLHTIYHVPAEQQAAAFLELHRVLRAGGTAVVVYEWGRRRRVRGAAGKVRRVLAAASSDRVQDGKPDASGPPSLYAHKHTHRWFEGKEWPFSYEIRVWRSVRSSFLRRFVHERISAGRLDLLYYLEERAPEFAGRFGSFPMIVIQKRPRYGPALAGRRKLAAAARAEVA